MRDASYDIQSIPVGPNDVIVVRFKERITRAAKDAVKADVERLFPDNKVIILDNNAGMEIYHVGTE